MFETWCAAEVILGLSVLVALITPPLYAWADRWIDRTRNKISDIVESKSEN
ncbi:MAG: hypothetical protein Q4Q53_08605 [Methanocorpusculum sp.]|nr:hypothetical protein [Methanocorpusculum sp.]